MLNEYSVCAIIEKTEVRQVLRTFRSDDVAAVRTAFSVSRAGDRGRLLPRVILAQEGTGCSGEKRGWG